MHCNSVYIFLTLRELKSRDNYHIIEGFSDKIGKGYLIPPVPFSPPVSQTLEKDGDSLFNVVESTVVATAVSYGSLITEAKGRMPNEC
jgi:hypothetical protein